MKRSLKILIPVVTLALLAALPFLGNTAVTQLLGRELDSLKHNGVRVAEERKEFGYLRSSVTWRLQIEDSEMFRRYVAENSYGDLYNTLARLAEGGEATVKIGYASLPFMDDVKVDLRLQRRSGTQARPQPPFALQPLELLGGEALAAHIEYDIKRRRFKGYCDDIDTTATLQGGEAVKLQLLGGRFEGVGNMMLPESFKAGFEHASAQFEQSNGTAFRFDMEALRSHGTIDPDGKSAIESRLGALRLVAGDTNSSSGFELDTMYLKTDVVHRGSQIDLATLSGCATGTLQLEGTRIELSDLKTDMELTGVDAGAYDALSVLLEAEGENPQKQMEIVSAAETLLEKGLTFRLDALDIDAVAVDGGPNLGGVDNEMTLVLQPGFNAMSAMFGGLGASASKMELDADLRISKALYAYIKEHTGIDILDRFAVEEGTWVLFRINNQSDTITVNKIPL